MLSTFPALAVRAGEDDPAPAGSAGSGAGNEPAVGVPGGARSPFPAVPCSGRAGLFSLTYLQRA